MDYILTHRQLDKMLRPYFDKYFAKSVFDTKTSEDGHKWTGYFIEDKLTGYYIGSEAKYSLLLGHPYQDDSNTWFYNGKILEGEIYFGLELEDFISSMKRYIENVLKQKVDVLM